MLPDSDDLTGRSRYRWIVLVLAFLGVFGAVGLGRFGYSAILPSMQEGLHTTSATAGAFASWNFAGYLIMAGASGVLSHRFGARMVVGVGTLVAAAGMLLTGMATGVAWASAARLLTGLGSGAVFVPCVAHMSSWFRRERWGTASGFVASGPALAMVTVGPVVPAVISAGGADGWRTAWYLFAGVTLVVGVLTLIFQRDRPRALADSTGATEPGWDAGAATLPEAGLAQAARDGGSGSKSGSTVLRHVLRSAFTWQLGITYMAFGFAYMIYVTFFQKRLTADLGLTSAEAGSLFLLLGAASLICGFLWGAISDRIGRGRALFINSLLQAAAAALMVWWPTLPGVILSVLLCGLTAVAVPGIIGAACGDEFGAGAAATALSAVTVMMGVGQMVGPYVAGKLADVSGSLERSYLLAAGAYVLASVLALSLRKASREHLASRKRALK